MVSHGDHDQTGELNNGRSVEELGIYFMYIRTSLYFFSRNGLANMGKRRAILHPL